MSHMSKITVELKNSRILEIAAKRIGASYAAQQEVAFFSGATHTGQVVHLKGWKYPIVVEGGQVHYDNYNGNWGKMEQFDALKQAYAIEMAKATAIQQGYTSWEERKLENGCVAVVARRAG